MKVELIKPTARFKGKVPGDIIQCDASVGNPLACLGLVRVVEHDPIKPGGKSSQIVNDDNAKRAKLEKDGD